MTTNETIRLQSFATVESDVPEGMTLADYRSRRPRPTRPRRLPLWRRPVPRRASAA